MIICRLLSILACVFIAVASAPTHAAQVAIFPAVSSVNLGDTFAVEVRISDLGAGTSVGVYDIDVGFDASFLTFDSVFFGSGLDVLGLGSVRSETLGVGTVNLFELSFDTVADLDALQPDSFLLVTLNFNATAPGTSPLTLTLNSLGDANGDDLPAGLINASVAIAAPAPVPEPGSYVLMLAGLIGLAWTTSRRAQ